MRNGRDTVGVGGLAMIRVEPWPPAMSGPYLVSDDDDVGDCQIVEGNGELHTIHPPDGFEDDQSIAFVDGVRRADARLYATGDGLLAYGIAGAHGTGAVLCAPGGRPTFHRCRIERCVIWGSGVRAELPDQRGGWSWLTDSVVDDHPDAPLHVLQHRMRETEGELAEELAESGLLTIVDGPLNFVRSRNLPVVGFVKTHHQPLLPPEAHAKVPLLPSGHRTSLFAKRDDIYSCYLRLAHPPAWAGPWSGIARLEFPSSTGLDAAIQAAENAAARLPCFAGVPHKDSRAPQNLLPIGQLERHLRRLLGDEALAIRATRQAAIAASRREGSA